LIVTSLGVGKIYNHSNESCQLVVSSIKELQVILNYFYQHPLRTQKRADYELFKRVLELIKEKEHLTEEGLRKILGIKASMNLGLGDQLKRVFPDIIPVVRPLVENQTIRDPN